ncbi:unnamed protein product, partial [Laminaria digitata]
GVKFPYSGKYEGSFSVLNGEGRKPREVEEENLHVEFERNSGGGWNVHRRGVNDREPFVWSGLLAKNGEIDIHREYLGGAR